MVRGAGMGMGSGTRGGSLWDPAGCGINEDDNVEVGWGWIHRRGWGCGDCGFLFLERLARGQEPWYRTGRETDAK